MTDLLRILISNPMTRAFVLASLRHAATAAGAALVAHGIGDASTTQALVGLVIALASWWLSQQDVKRVDAKITAAVALAPDSPTETINALKQGKF